MRARSTALEDVLTFGSTRTPRAPKSVTRRNYQASGFGARCAGAERNEADRFIHDGLVAMARLAIAMQTPGTRHHPRLCHVAAFSLTVEYRYHVLSNDSIYGMLECQIDAMPSFLLCSGCIK